MTEATRIDSVAHAADLDRALARPGTDAMRVAEDLFGLADLIRADSRLRRALTDPARSGDDKAALARDAFGNHVQEATLSVIEAMARSHWSHPEDVHDALEVLGIVSVLTDAHRAGRLDEVSDELFDVRRLFADQRELRLRLADPATGDAHRRGDLAQALLEGRITGWTMRLVRRAVGRSKHGRLLHNLRRFARWAAVLEGRLLVTVESAAQMTPEQIDRLRSILARRFGQEIALSVSIDPDVVGGFRVRAGTTAVDASLATRMADMRRRLVG
ncbi:F0F1 ATP synthase subunit delta [Actinomyces sp. B33]|uniref:F0F1 ATP synthase subunit delta n=1 Tax=Actinomyces sp. B33 TaxID=2942131 RepID=UPI0023419387|nr:F0F1 ATP synthase subunit delta [Actinomyces sp. B33]MDC4232856.1 F0F1 ATP synthase subunit delta [Actinomyces sp. B33]